MIVYVVTSGEYSDYGIEAVFDNKEQAEMYCAAHDWRLDANHIEEYDTEEHHFVSEKPVLKRWVGVFCKGKYGPSFSMKLPEYTYLFEKKVKKGEYGWKRNNAAEYVVVTLDKNSTEDQAKKVIHDLYAQWKYEREG